MASVITHPAVAFGLAPHFKGFGPRVWLLGVFCTVIPDIDAIGFWWGIPYGHPLGHRGLTHSFSFALAAAGVICLFARHSSESFPWLLFAYLSLCGVSHGLADALTNGGLGVAFFAPFSNERFFFPWRPIVVSPISITRFFSGRSLQVLASEFKWLVLPSAVVGLLGFLRRRARA